MIISTKEKKAVICSYCVKYKHIIAHTKSKIYDLLRYPTLDQFWGWSVLRIQ